MTDAMTAVAALPGVADAAVSARNALDSFMFDRGVRAKALDLARDSIVRGGRDSAYLDGADVAVVDDSPMGRVLSASMSVTAAIPSMVDTWSRSPLQVLASLHSLAAAEFSDADERGRPRRSDECDDPLRLGDVPPWQAIGPRLESLRQILTEPTQAPALVTTAVVHAELAVLRPFMWGSGIISRAATRLMLSSRGLDPDLLTVPESAIVEAGRPAYVRALKQYAAGTPYGVAAWVIWHCERIEESVA